MSDWVTDWIDSSVLSLLWLACRVVDSSPVWSIVASFCDRVRFFFRFESRGFGEARRGGFDCLEIGIRIGLCELFRTLRLVCVARCVWECVCSALLEFRTELRTALDA